MLFFFQAWNVRHLKKKKTLLNKNEENQNVQNKIYKKRDGLYFC